MTRPLHAFSRRGLLGAGASLFAWAHAPRASSAASQTPQDKRLLVVLLRGGLDGLAAVPAVGDPAFASLRAVTPRQQAELQAGTLQLQDVFALNAHLSRLHGLFRGGEAAIIHAAATSSRERSHFAAQDVLESGLPLVTGGSAPSGWLNRALQAMPRGERLRPDPSFAVAPTVPLILRGSAPVDTWQPQAFQAADADTINRVQNLYASRDAALASALTRGTATDALLGTAAGRPEGGMGNGVVAQTVNAVVRVMARPDGPRIGAMSVDGWDTHIDQGFERGRMAGQLGTLDAVFGALKEGLAPVWSQTVVLVATEFGRTARINGSSGTDHGTGTIAVLLGGAVKGGRVIADWPGLAPNQLFEGRDLAPTIDLRSVLKGLLRDHLGVEGGVLESAVFPSSASARALGGLLRL